MKIKYILCVLIGVMTTASCTKQKQFQIEGNIMDAPNQTIYLEQMTLTKNILIDSTTINSQGEFKLRASAPDYPDIYRLRLGNKQFLFPVDSCECIRIESNASNFDFPELIEGSMKALQLQELRTSLVQLQKNYQQAENNTENIQQLLQQIDLQKQKSKQIILDDPRSIVAYYALYQKIDNLLLFTPYNQEDRKLFAAVATAFHAYMPQYYRTENIYKWVLDVMQEERAMRNQEAINQMIADANNGFLDIELPDIKGDYQKMSSLIGKVFLLDFSLMAIEQNIAYTFELRELYNRFHQHGFQIYQVSVDPNQMFWEESVKELPWITVRGEQSETEKILQTYNVTQLPTTFLFDKTGEIVGRDIPFNQIGKHIELLLK